MDTNFLTAEEALAMLPPGEEIHTFVNPRGFLIGAHWDRAAVEASVCASPCRRTAGMAKAMGHGLCIEEPGGPVFVETISLSGEE